jgi:hypothetical protein
MPIQGKGWELHIQRSALQRRGSKIRTVGAYQVFHDGVAQAAFTGGTAEPRGPGDNSVENDGLRIEAKSYPLERHAGAHYCTVGYQVSDKPGIHPKPGIGVGDTGKRVGIVVHPGFGFLSSIGCINICSPLGDALFDISFVNSRDRVIALIDDLKAFAGPRFPQQPGPIPGAFLVIDGEP